MTTETQKKSGEWKTESKTRNAPQNMSNIMWANIIVNGKRIEVTPLHPVNGWLAWEQCGMEESDSTLKAEREMEMDMKLGSVGKAQLSCKWGIFVFGELLRASPNYFLITSSAFVLLNSLFVFYSLPLLTLYISLSSSRSGPRSLHHKLFLCGGH